MTPKRAPRPKVRPRRISSNGGVDYALGQIDSQLTMVQQILSEDRLSSAHYRTHIREVLDSLQGKSSHMEGQMDHVTTALAKMEGQLAKMDERIEKLETHHNERTGFKKAMELIAKGGYIIAGGIGSIVALVVDRYLKGTPGPHP